MPFVVLALRRGVKDEELGELDELDAQTLAQELFAGRSLAHTHPTLPAKSAGGKIEAAAKREPVVGQTNKVVLDEDELVAFHQACRESLELQSLPSFEALCAKVAKAIASH